MATTKEIADGMMAMLHTVLEHEPTSVLRKD